MTTLSDLKAEFLTGKIAKPEFIRRALTIHRVLFEYVDTLSVTEVKEIRIDAEGVRFLVGEDRLWLHCPADEGRVAPIEMMNFDRYEPEETSVMDRLLAGSATIFDIGANIGWYTVRFAKRMPAAHVFAFEPMPIAYSYLQRNVAANGFGSRVSTFNYGLSNKNGPIEFFVAPMNGTNASMKNVAGADDAQRSIGVALTLDQWVVNYRVAPEFIKCDVEGAELLVFQGAAATLERCRPIVFCELLRKWTRPFGYHPNDLIRFFAKLEYCCFGVGAGGLRRIADVTDETAETNYVFLHTEAHEKLIASMGSQ